MLIVAALVILEYRLLFPPEPPQPAHFDSVIVPGGGLDAVGQPAPWVVARLDAALRHDAHTKFYTVLSRGTTHKPPPRDDARFPIDESAASARYLIKRGVDPSRVLQESWSVDTIGNGAFTRLMHADPRQWKRLHVVTSDFHLPRVKAIFEWIFALPPGDGRVQLSFEASLALPVCPFITHTPSPL